METERVYRVFDDAITFGENGKDFHPCPAEGGEGAKIYCERGDPRYLSFEKDFRNKKLDVPGYTLKVLYTTRT